MKSLEKNVLIWHSPQQMFDLVADVEAYPQFLPWCDHAAVLQRQSHGMTAQLGLHLAGVRQRFTTQNTHVLGGPDAALEIHIALQDGPFSNLQGRWAFRPIGTKSTGKGASPSACKINYTMQYGFSNGALEAVVGPIFHGIANSLVDAFVKRAEQVYGA
jgi:ribosome-associated toxin RatA of RatAB toxin-antitoxin module